LAGGYNCTANGLASVSIGYTNQAPGNYAGAFGFGTSASGSQSFAVGYNTSATGNLAISAGNTTTAQSYASLIIGRYNTISGSTTNWVSTDPLFVAGNGSNGSSRSNALILYKNGNMTIAGTLTQNSDFRLKEKIEPIYDVLSNLKHIKPVYFEFKDKEMYPENRQIGFIAQNIREYYPEIVSENEDGILSVDYTKMSVLLLEAINEQQEIIIQQEEENKKLQLQIDEINQKLNDLMNK
jgi:hypothetical protein